MREPRRRNCRLCGTSFETYKTNQQYCTKAHAKEGALRKSREAVRRRYAFGGDRYGNPESEKLRKRRWARENPERVRAYREDWERRKLQASLGADGTVMRTCLFCGVKYPFGCGGYKYCGEKCRNAAQKQKARRCKKPQAVERCERCGQQFRATRSTQRFCGSDCMKKSKNERERNRRKEKRDREKGVAVLLLTLFCMVQEAGRALSRCQCRE